MEVRRVHAGEGARLRELRLRALREAPYAFLATEEEDAARPPESWDALAAASDAATDSVVMVAADGDEWTGLAGAYRDGEAVVVWGMWVDPRARRRGTGRGLLEALVSWAASRGASRVDLSVSDAAAPAAALYRSCGFAPTGERRPLASAPELTEIVLTRPLAPADAGEPGRRS